MPHTHGRFAWHRLNTADPAAAAAFYPRVTPWSAQPWDVADDYTLWMNAGRPVGGAVSLTDEFSALGLGSHWLPYVSVYDVDDCARQAVKLGARLRTGPAEIPNVGCWAVLSDPQGAAFGVYEPDRPRVPEPVPAVGEFSWHELATTDYKSAFDFYRALFKWEQLDEYDMGEMGIYFMFGLAGQMFGGMFSNRPGPAPRWLSYVRVDDVANAAKRVAEAGGSVANGPMEVPNGAWIAQCVDGQGAQFAVQTLAPE